MRKLKDPWHDDDDLFIASGHRATLLPLPLLNATYLYMSANPHCRCVWSNREDCSKQC
jgi:hypothetical protein